jgi:predicted DNA-binding transcriptional regulator YafY
VWEARRVTVGYRRAGGEVERVLDPLGLVLKAGTWYLVASPGDGEARTYRVSRFSRVTPGTATFERPPGFDLAEHWRASIDAYERSAPRVDLEVRVDARAIGILADVVGERAVRAAERIGPPDADGWQRLRLTVDWPEEVPGRLVAMGDRLEVLEPAEVRDAVIATAERVVERYRAIS